MDALISEKIRSEKGFLGDANGGAESGRIDLSKCNKLQFETSAQVIDKVDIGNIPPNEVDAFMEQMINKMKKVPYVDQRTGNYNLKFN